MNEVSNMEIHIYIYIYCMELSQPLWSLAYQLALNHHGLVAPTNKKDERIYAVHSSWQIIYMTSIRKVLHLRGVYFVIHYSDVIMSVMTCQITSTRLFVNRSGAHQRKYQSSASQAFVWGIHRSLVNSPHKWPVTQKMYPFDDVTMDVSIYW